MVKFSKIELSTPSSSSNLHDGPMLKTPNSAPRNEKYLDSGRARWSPSEEAILVHLMVKEVHKGNRVDLIAGKRVWKNIGQVFYEKTQKRFSFSQLRNKFYRLRARYSEFRKLLRKPGFHWNPALRCATATDDVWEAYIKEHDVARIFRQKRFPLYNELGVIFGDPVEVCNKVTQSNSEFKFGTEDESAKSSNSASAKENVCMEQEAVISPGHQPQQFPPPVGEIRRETDLRASAACEPTKEPKECGLPHAAVKKEFSEVSCPKTTNLRPNGLESCSSAFSITSTIKCLESIPGIGSSTYVKAVKMFKDVDWREMFMAMSAERRLDWLASLD